MSNNHTGSERANSNSTDGHHGRTRWVMGNWKMNPLRKEAIQLADALATGLSKQTTQPLCQLAVFPVALHTLEIETILHESPIELGCQDVSVHRGLGASTGELSAELLKDAGAQWVLVGHSERRSQQGESEALLSAKLKAALESGLNAVLCVGETLSEREAGRAEAVVAEQLTAQLVALADRFDAQRVVVAYEPVWAIGTGKSASPEDAQAMHAFIRQLLEKHRADLKTVSVLYGGSVKPDNAGLLASCPDIDGALVGGASLKAADFLAIARAFSG